MVAMDSVAQKPSTDDFEKWFANPRLFEIGRTRAVALSRVDTGPCKPPDPQPQETGWLPQCQSIHPDDEWRGFDPLPDPWVRWRWR